MLAFGTSSRSSPTCFPPSAPNKLITPVMFPPGRLRLATRPAWTGSPPLTNTIGIVVVAALAASAEVSPPLVTMTATRRVTKSSARAGRRSYWPSPQRNAIATFLPSMYPASFRPSRNAASMGTSLSGDRALKYPISGIPGCCARPANGHKTAAPPTRPINSRRLMGALTDRGPHRTTTNESSVVHHSNDRDVLTVDKTSETLKDSGQALWGVTRSSGVQITDHRQCRLLRACYERPRNRT